jgi:hypothetical protein
MLNWRSRFLGREIIWTRGFLLAVEKYHPKTGGSAIKSKDGASLLVPFCLIGFKDPEKSKAVDASVAWSTDEHRMR